MNGCRRELAGRAALAAVVALVACEGEEPSSPASSSASGTSSTGASSPGSDASSSSSSAGGAGASGGSAGAAGDGGAGGSVGGAGGSAGNGGTGGNTGNGGTGGNGGSGGSMGGAGDGGSGGNAGSGGASGGGGAGPSCGDGQVDPGEECDEGNANSNAGACKIDCTIQVCGDGFLGPSEACDDGNVDPTDACTTACEPAACGDGFVEAGVEACDDGNSNDADACLVGCIPAACGDGFVEQGVEQCDDGNSSDSDACLTECTNASCGDGILYVGIETCDLGLANSNSGSCTSACQVAMCGDGLVYAGVESCDDGDSVQGNGCNPDCVLSGSVVWTKTFNDAIDGDDYAFGVAAGAGGNLFVAGRRDVANQSANIMVRKYDSDGNFVWTVGQNGLANDFDQGNGVAIDSVGDVVVAGTTTPATGQLNSWVRKYIPTNPMPATVWTSTGVLDEARAVAVGPSDNVLFAGGNHGPGPSSDLAVAKVFAGTGNLSWKVIYDGPLQDSSEFGLGVAVGVSGGVVVVGWADTASNGRDALVLKYDQNGSLLWDKLIDGPAHGDDEAAAVTIDSTGAIFVAGSMATAQSFDVWVAKLAVDGKIQWEFQYAGASGGDDRAHGVSLDSMGDVVVCGEELVAGQQSDILVLKLDATGQLKWTRTFDGPASGPDAAYGVTTDSGDHVIVAGHITTAAQGSDLWLRKYTP